MLMGFSSTLSLLSKRLLMASELKDMHLKENLISWDMPNDGHSLTMLMIYAV
jgi:hypothetical protein